MRKVLLFGGSFDPIHNGHLHIAKKALAETNHDALWFLLAGLSPFKEDASSFASRKDMIELMIKDDPNLEICDIESTLPVPSYSVDTIKALKEKHPNTQFDWLIGSDQLDALDQWKDIDILKSWVTFYVYQRPGYNNDHGFKKISGDMMDVSSTAIRQGKSYETDPLILKYMMENGLYLHTMLQSHMSEKRYNHTLNVTKLALSLAKTHSIDLDKTMLSAMMHDYCKEWDMDTLTQIVSEYKPEALSLPKAYYHAYGASYILKEKYHITDIEVLDAIENHVSGETDFSLGKVLFIADKCEKGRPYDASEYVRIAHQDLNKGFIAVKENQKKYLKENL